MSDLFAQAEPLTVTQLTLAIKGELEQQFAGVWVSGEVGSLSRPQSGHLYFTLKDAGAQMPAVMWRSVSLRHKFDLKEGLAVVIRGRLTVYPPHGKYQLEVEKLEPQGIGARELALRQLREKLFTKGYFDPRRKKKLPAFPNRIALVTSPSGAAVRDMLQVLVQRWPACEVVVCPVRVQGDGCELEIASAISTLNRLHADGQLAIDAMIVGRGGGSAEDLWAFNDERIADAIFRSNIPVISAVGHEIDVSISDLVADVHALTPTDAANRVVPNRADLLQALHELRNRMEDSVLRRITHGRQRLDSLAAHGVFRRPLGTIREHEERLDDISVRLKRVVRQRVERLGEAVAAIAGRLQTLSPLNVLSRGYSLTRTEKSEELIRDAAAVSVGDRLITRVATGAIISRVEQVSAADDRDVPVREDDSEAGTAA